MSTKPALALSLRTDTRHRIPRWVRRLAGPLLLLALWQAASEIGVIDERTLAPPSTVISTGWDLLQSGELQENIWASLRRVAIGLTLGTAIGVSLAIVAGLFTIGEDLIDAPVQMLRTLPVLALVPLFIVWFGIDETPKIALIVFGTAFPIYLNTYAGIRNVDVKLVEAAATLGLSRGGLIRHVILPGAWTSFLVGLRYSLGIAWLVLVVSEQINATDGLGDMMTKAREFNRLDIIVLGLVIYALLGLASDLIVRGLEKTSLSWRRSFSGT